MTLARIIFTAGATGLVWTGVTNDWFGVAPKTKERSVPADRADKPHPNPTPPPKIAAKTVAPSSSENYEPVSNPPAYEAPQEVTQSPVNDHNPSTRSARDMTLSRNGVEFLKAHESLRLTVYEDRNGNKTIGYGHKLLEGESFPDGITESEAENILLQDVNSAIDEIHKRVKVPLTQNQFDALVSLTFNIGIGAFRRSNLLVKLNQENYQGAKQEFYGFIFGTRPDGTVVKNPQKLQRRREEAALFNSKA